MRLKHPLRDPLGRRGIAAVEFALVAPFLFILLLGLVEMLTIYRAEAKLNAVTFNVAQMVSRAQSVGTSSAPISDVNAGTPYTAASSPEQVVSLPDICQGAVSGLAPFPSGGLIIDIASLTEEQGPNGLPSAYKLAQPTYDQWEYDQVVSGGYCNVTAGTAVLSGAATANAENTMISVPCDNVIVVQATLPYPGVIGLFLPRGATLSQTAYVRWAPALPTNELMCNPTAAHPGGSGCNQVAAITQECNTNDQQTN